MKVLFFTGLSVGGVCGIGIGLAIGVYVAESSMMANAVNAGVAYYECDQNTGRVEFKWNMDRSQHTAN